MKMYWCESKSKHRQLTFNGNVLICNVPELFEYIIKAENMMGNNPCHLDPDDYEAVEIDPRVDLFRTNAKDDCR